jgi:hypothetical protein
MASKPRDPAGPATRASHRFYAHPREDARSHAHLIPGAESLQDAALRFAEHWSGAAPDGEVRVIAFDGETGEARCFCIDLGAGEVEPCR